jgi:hypothetical protein
MVFVNGDYSLEGTGARISLEGHLPADDVDLQTVEPLTPQVSPTKQAVRNLNN